VQQLIVTKNIVENRMARQRFILWRWCPWCQFTKSL